MQAQEIADYTEFKIGPNHWVIKETAPSGLYVVYKNGAVYECCAGSEYETESGACYAILNEYRYE